MKRLFFTAGLLAFLIIAQGQVVDSAALHIHYVPKLPNSKKINSQAVIVDTSQQKVKFNYYISPQKMDLNFTPGAIKAGKIGPEVQERHYRNYIKMGFGYPVTPLAEIGMHNCQSNKYSYGLNFHHFSSWAEPVGKIQKNYAYAPTSDTRVRLFFKRFFKHHTLYSTVGFNHELANLYGYHKEWAPTPPDSTIDYYSKAYRDSIHNNFIHLNAKIGFGSNYTVEDRRVKEKAELDYDFIRTSHKDMEHGLKLRSFVAYDARFLKISGYQHYRLDFNVDYYHNAWNDSILGGTDNTVPMKHLDNSFKIEFCPTMNFSIKEYHLLLGVGVPIINSQDTIRCPLYPVAELQMGLIRGIMSLYVGVDGESKYNSLQNLLYENPYLKPQLDSTRFTRTQLNIYGGIKGNLVKKLNYHVSARYSFAKDMAFFQLDTNSLLKNCFDVVYRDVNRLNVCANISWEAVNHLYLSLNANYWGYYFPKKDTTMKPWYKPEWEVGFEGKYVLKEKFIFSLNAQLGFQRWALEPKRHIDESGKIQYTYTPEKMKPILNFNAGFEYLITKQFSAFAQINNIGFQYVSTYHNFNNFGINVLAGVSYSFGNEPLKPQKKKKP